jgi:hypothetical protein
VQQQPLTLETGTFEARPAVRASTIGGFVFHDRAKKWNGIEVTLTFEPVSVRRR